MCGKTLVAGKQIIATELGSIMLQHVALIPDPSTNNRPGSEASCEKNNTVYWKCYNALDTHFIALL